MRMLLNNIRYGLMDEKLAGETVLRASGVPFTVVRPGGLTNAEAGKADLSHSAPFPSGCGHSIPLRLKYVRSGCHALAVLGGELPVAHVLLPATLQTRN